MGASSSIAARQKLAPMGRSYREGGSLGFDGDFGLHRIGDEAVLVRRMV